MYHYTINRPAGKVTIHNDLGVFQVKDAIEKADYILRARDVNDATRAYHLGMRTWYLKALEDWEEASRGDGYIVDSLNNRVCIQTEKGYEGVVAMIDDFSKRIEIAEGKNQDENSARLRTNRAEYLKALEDWEDKQKPAITQEEENMTTGFITTTTPDGIHIQIESAHGFDLSIRRVINIAEAANLSDLSESDRHELLPLINEMHAHLEAQKVWVTKPVPNIEALKELANYIVDYASIPVTELGAKYPTLIKADDEATTRYHTNIRTADANGIDSVDHARINWFMIPALKKALGRPE